MVTMSKRLLIIIGILIVVILGITGFSLAFALSHMNSASTSDTATATPTVDSTVTSASGNTANKSRISGTISSLGSSSFVLSINSGKKSVTVTITNQTTYAQRGKQLSFSDLQVGERVRVDIVGTYSKQDTTVVAQRVSLLASSPGGLSATPTTTN